MSRKKTNAHFAPPSGRSWFQSKTNLTAKSAFNYIGFKEIFFKMVYENLQTTTWRCNKAENDFEDDFSHSDFRQIGNVLICVNK